MEVTLAALLVTGALVAARARPRLRWRRSLLGARGARAARGRAARCRSSGWPARSRRRRAATSCWLPVAVAGAMGRLQPAPRSARRYPATAAAKIEGGLVGWLGGRARAARARRSSQRPWAVRDANGCAGCGGRTRSCRSLLLPGLWLALAARRPRGARLPASCSSLHPLAMALLAPYRGPGIPGRPLLHPPAAARRRRSPRLGRSPRSRPRGAAGERPGRRLARAWLLAAGARGASGLPRGRRATLGGAEHRGDAGAPRPLGRAPTRRPTRGSALNDVGAIAYVSRREVVDVMGLVTPAILPYRREGEPACSATSSSLPRLPDRLPGLVPDASRRWPSASIPCTACALAHNEVAGPTRWWSTRPPGAAGAGSAALSGALARGGAPWSRPWKCPGSYNRDQVSMTSRSPFSRWPGARQPAVGRARARVRPDLPLDRRAGRDALLPGHRERPRASAAGAVIARARANSAAAPAGRAEPAAPSARPRGSARIRFTPGPAHHGVDAKINGGGTTPAAPRHGRRSAR